MADQKNAPKVDAASSASSTTTNLPEAPGGPVESKSIPDQESEDRSVDNYLIQERDIGMARNYWIPDLDCFLATCYARCSKGMGCTLKEFIGYPIERQLELVLGCLKHTILKWSCCSDCGRKYTGTCVELVISDGDSILEYCRDCMKRFKYIDCVRDKSCDWSDHGRIVGVLGDDLHVLIMCRPAKKIVPATQT